MTSNILKFITIALMFFTCTDDKKTDNHISKSIDSSILIKHTTNNENGPPFSDTCLCSFEYIGKIRTSIKRYDIIISGKGWNPSFYSCSWTWGELISNESTDDSTITDFRIHLVDIDKLDDNIDSTFLNSKQFNDKLIATYSLSGRDEYMTCKFDPNKTGKYPKPKQWTE